MKHNPSFSVPEGYFERLESSLSEIPYRPAAITPTVWERVKPYLCLAACFVFALFLGNLFLRGNKTEVRNVADNYEYVEPYQEDDAIEYLIEYGASVDYISCLLNQ